MENLAAREPVRLGFQGVRPIFEQAEGLHDLTAGLSVVAGGGPDDPLVMFEEHGTGEICRYFEVQPHAVLAPGLNPAIASPRLRKQLGDEDTRSVWFAVRGIFGQEDPVYVNQVVAQLRQDVGSGGLVPFVEISRRFQRRTALIRILAAARAQPNRPLSEIARGPHPLDHHAGGAHIFASYLYEPLVLMGSPFTRGFVAGRAIQESSQAALLVFMGGTREGEVLKDADVTWSSIYENDLPNLRALDPKGTTWMRHTNHHILKIDASQLLRWWTHRLNILLTEATDLGRYRKHDASLDAGRAYRELRTLERVIANCVRIQARPTDHLARVALGYEFFDLLPNLVSPHPSAPNVWDRLANPANAQRILDDAFKTAPADIKRCLGARTKAVLAKFRDETLEHVVAGHRSGNKVIVGGKPYTCDTFIAQLFHQLRNTHHGYELDTQVKRDLVTAHTGHISEAFPELVVLYTIALVSDPQSVFSGPWF